MQLTIDRKEIIVCVLCQRVINVILTVWIYDGKNLLLSSDKNVVQPFLLGGSILSHHITWISELDFFFLGGRGNHEGTCTF